MVSLKMYIFVFCFHSAFVLSTILRAFLYPVHSFLTLVLSIQLFPVKNVSFFSRCNSTKLKILFSLALYTFQMIY